jgi:DNA-binding transcriptional MerR regulator
MGQNTYKTKEIAQRVGIHVNTVRFYEEIGFLTKPERTKNGYRIFTQLHLDECALIRRAMRAEVLQNGLRNKAVEIVRLCAALDFDAAYSAAEEYCRMIDSEITNAKNAVAAVEGILNQKALSDEVICLRRQEAADQLGVTAETLRTWERSGLLKVRRQENGYRVYNADDLERLNIIRTLRCANYSLSAILRLLNGLDRNETSSVEAALNTPEGEDILSACDRLILSLGNTKSDALLLLSMITEMRKKYCTLQ